jgi:hypothetical protein
MSRGYESIARCASASLWAPAIWGTTPGPGGRPGAYTKSIFGNSSPGSRIRSETASPLCEKRRASSAVKGVRFTMMVERSPVASVTNADTMMCCDGSSTPKSFKALRAVAT